MQKRGVRDPGMFKYEQTGLSKFSSFVKLESKGCMVNPCWVGSKWVEVQEWRVSQSQIQAYIVIIVSYDSSKG